MKGEGDIGTTFRCPRCGSTDLRVEVPVAMLLKPDGQCEFLDGYAGSVFDLIEHCYANAETMCNDCEDSGRLPEFEVTEAAKEGAL